MDANDCCSPRLYIAKLERLAHHNGLGVGIPLVDRIALWPQIVRCLVIGAVVILASLVSKVAAIQKLGALAALLAKALA